MNCQIKHFLSFFFILTHFLFIQSCSTSQPSLTPIKVGVLLSPNSLPMIIAEKEGFFKKQGIEVKVIEYQHVKSKNTSFKNKETDLMITDLSSAIRLKSEGCDLKIISLIRGGDPKQGRVAILTGPNGIHSLEDLPNNQLAVIPDSITEFSADQLLEEMNIPLNTIKKTCLNNYSEVLQKLLNNEVEAGVLVNPLVTFAEFQGCRVLKDDSECSLCFLVLVAQKNFTNNKEALKTFLNTYYDFVSELSQKPTTYRHYLLDLASFPCTDPESIRTNLLAMTRASKRIKHTIPIPEYSQHSLPNRDQIKLVGSWLLSKKLISSLAEFDELVATDLF